MNKLDIFGILNSNPVFYLATCEGSQPRARAMMLYKADESGIIFHTGSMKELYSQLKANPKAELCFFDAKNNIQIRVSGSLEEITDAKVKDEIAAHPSREFVRQWKEKGIFKDFYKEFIVFALKNGTASVWTFASNFGPKEKISL
jgi:uncharacterized pyridoxamine 5'-phosphate oxidase family protein